MGSGLPAVASETPYMGLEARLRRLKGLGPGSAAGSPGSDPRGSASQGLGLAERLRRLSPGRPRPRSPAPPDDHALAEHLGAQVLGPGVLRVERVLDRRLRHGKAPLGSVEEPCYLPMPADCTSCDPPPPWLCLDIETSGLAGGTGTWVFMIGLMRQTGAGWVLRQYLLTRLDAEARYLESASGELTELARLLTFNGRAFDAPLLATRFRLIGTLDPLAGLPHLDLFGPVRRAFGGRWPDCRLATAESRLLGLERRDDLPGSAAPTAWLGWLRGGEMDPLGQVLRHNRLDLYSLAALLPRLDAAYRDPAAHGANLRSVAAAHRERGRWELALDMLARDRRHLDAAGLLDLASLYRRKGHWSQAVAIWESLEAAGEVQARVALARYHEHRSRDLERALTLTEALPLGEDRERRRARLLVKRARPSACR